MAVGIGFSPIGTVVLSLSGLTLCFIICLICHLTAPAKRPVAKVQQAKLV